MEKAITHVGNSFALILDKALCRIVGIGHGSIVNVTLDDGRIVVERTGRRREPSPRAQRRGLPRRAPRVVRDPISPMLGAAVDDYSLAELKKHALPIAHDLVQKGLGQYLDRLHYDRGMQPMRFVLKVERIDPARAHARDVVLLRRLRSVWDDLSQAEAGTTPSRMRSRVIRGPKTAATPCQRAAVRMR